MNRRRLLSAVETQSFISVSHPVFALSTLRFSHKATAVVTIVDMDQVIFPLAPGVTHPFSLEGGEAAPTAPTLPDISKLPQDEIAEAVLAIAKSEAPSSPSTTPSSQQHPDESAAAAYGPWSLLSPGQAKIRKRARVVPNTVTPQLRSAPAPSQHKRRPATHKHGRGAGKGRDLHPLSGEPHFADMHPSWQAIRRIGRRQAKAVKRDLTEEQ